LVRVDYVILIGRNSKVLCLKKKKKLLQVRCHDSSLILPTWGCGVWVEYGLRSAWTKSLRVPISTNDYMQWHIPVILAM
jgi:hypothetical protein